MADTKVPVIDEQFTYNLIQEVRNKTDISYETSKLALCVVLSEIETLLPDIDSKNVITQLLTFIPKSEVTVEILDSTEDCEVLSNVLNKLVEVKEDSQQRSWQLHEDEENIITLVEKLQKVLADADPAICARVLSRNDYTYIESLVEYYQMEPRWSIRCILLQVFGMMCGIDKTVITILLNSILPQELARDIRQSYSQSPVRVLHSTMLITMVFSMGEHMPMSHLDQLGQDFIDFILTGIENIETEEDELMSDGFLNFLLAYNLQFKPNKIDNNILLECLSKRSQANVFTSKILVMFNREVDPARIFSHEPAPVHSILKLFIDLFNNEKTANLFYTNDVKVLIDILVRQICDISPGEKQRTLYLEICRAVLNRCEYDDHRHRSDDLLKCFRRIQEEIPLVKNDTEIISAIIEEHFQ